MRHDASKYADLPYSTEWLVRAAETNRAFLKLKSPRDPRVLEAIRRVDRAEFLGDDLLYINHTDTEILDTMQDILARAVERAKYSIVIPGRAPALELADELCESVVSLLLKRTEFALPARVLAYNDVSLPIIEDKEHGRMSCATQPSLVAFMSDVLDLRHGQNVLEVGSGCGYHAAVIAELIGGGRLTTIEIIPELYERARRNLEKYKRVHAVQGDGSVGYMPSAPYDRMYFTAGSKGFDPDRAKDQLNESGILLYPDDKTFNLIRRNGSDFSHEHFGSIGNFTSLTGENA